MCRSTVIRSLESVCSQNSFGLAYIYCNYKERDVQTASNLIACLLKQLLQNHSQLPDDVTSSYKHHLNVGTRPSITEYSSLLQSTASRTSNIFIIIDALDEYIEEDGSRDKFLTEIKRLEPNMHLLVTSRWVPTIELEFERTMRLEIRAHDEDIRKYLHDRIQKTKRLRSHVEADPSLRDAIVNTLVENSQGMYVFQSIQCLLSELCLILAQGFY